MRKGRAAKVSGYLRQEVRDALDAEPHIDAAPAVDVSALCAAELKKYEGAPAARFDAYLKFKREKDRREEEEHRAGLEAFKTLLQAPPREEAEGR